LPNTYFNHKSSILIKKQKNIRAKNQKKNTKKRKEKKKERKATYEYFSRTTNNLVIK
jgi:hypothetical protein